MRFPFSAVAAAAAADADADVCCDGFIFPSFHVPVFCSFVCLFVCRDISK